MDRPPLPPRRSRSRSPPPSAHSNRPRTRDWPTSWDAAPAHGHPPYDQHGSASDRWSGGAVVSGASGASGAYAGQQRWTNERPWVGDERREHHDWHDARPPPASNDAYYPPSHHRDHPYDWDAPRNSYHLPSSDRWEASRASAPPPASSSGGWGGSSSGHESGLKGRDEGERWRRDRYEGYDDRVAYGQESARASGYPGEEHQSAQPHAADDTGYEHRHHHQQEKHEPEWRRLKPTSEVSAHVIFLGIDPGMDESDLFNFLKVSGSEVESTTIIRDKSTGLSKGFGFALFASEAESTRFVEAHFPNLLIPFGTSAPRRVKIDYSSTPGPRGGAGPAFAAPPAENDGMRDIAPGAGGGRVLLLRGVDRRTKWADVLEKLERVEVVKGQVRRVIGVGERDDPSRSWGFGFVEMRTVEAARALLAHAMSPTIYPHGFTLPPSASPVSTSFANPTSFLLAPPGWPGTTSAGGPGGVGDLPKGGGEVRYWDEGGGVEVCWAHGWEAADAAEEQALKAASGSKKKKDAGRATQQEKKDEGVKPTALRRLEKDGMVPIAIKLGGTKGAKADKAATSVFGAAQESDDEDEAADEQAQARALVKGKLYKVPPMATSKKVATSISKWNTTQKELASVPPPASAGFAPSADSANAALSHVRQPRDFKVNVPPKEPSGITEPVTVSLSAPFIDVDADDEFEYADPKKTACLLCQRQLKSIDQLRKHIAASDLHKRNLQDAALRQLAKDKVAAAKAASASEYRDRAAERRVAFNQPDAPPPTSHSAGAKRKFVEGPTKEPTPPPAEPVPAPAQDASNVGNKLLAKMGWSAGQGLGLQGEGRLEPVQTQMFAARAGLGAAKPTEPPKGGDRSYAEKAKESARDRY